MLNSVINIAYSYSIEIGRVDFTKLFFMLIIKAIGINATTIRSARVIVYDIFAIFICIFLTFFLA